MQAQRGAIGNRPAVIAGRERPSALGDVPKEAFSMLQPLYSDPSAATTTAPTRKWLYGEYEFSATRLASAISRCDSFMAPAVLR